MAEFGTHNFFQWVHVCFGPKGNGEKLHFLYSIGTSDNERAPHLTPTCYVDATKRNKLDLVGICGHCSESWKFKVKFFSEGIFFIHLIINFLDKNYRFLVFVLPPGSKLT